MERRLKGNEPAEPYPSQIQFQTYSKIHALTAWVHLVVQKHRILCVCIHCDSLEFNVLVLKFRANILLNSQTSRVLSVWPFSRYESVYFGCQTLIHRMMWVLRIQKTTPKSKVYIRVLPVMNSWIAIDEHVFVFVISFPYSVDIFDSVGLETFSGKSLIVSTIAFLVYLLKFSFFRLFKMHFAIEMEQTSQFYSFFAPKVRIEWFQTIEKIFVIYFRILCSNICRNRFHFVFEMIFDTWYQLSCSIWTSCDISGHCAEEGIFSSLKSIFFHQNSFSFEKRLNVVICQMSRFHWIVIYVKRWVH